MNGYYYNVKLYMRAWRVGAALNPATIDTRHLYNIICMAVKILQPQKQCEYNHTNRISYQLSVILMVASNLLQNYVTVKHNMLCHYYLVYHSQNLSRLLTEQLIATATFPFQLAKEDHISQQCCLAFFVLCFHLCSLHCSSNWSSRLSLQLVQ